MESYFLSIIYNKVITIQIAIFTDKFRQDKYIFKKNKRYLTQTIMY